MGVRYITQIYSPGRGGYISGFAYDSLDEAVAYIDRCIAEYSQHGITAKMRVKWVDNHGAHVAHEREC